MPDDRRDWVAAGLVEFLRATAPAWADKLTAERLAFCRTVSGLSGEVDRQRRTIADLAAALRDRRDRCRAAPDCFWKGGRDDRLPRACRLCERDDARVARRAGERIRRRPKVPGPACR